MRSRTLRKLWTPAPARPLHEHLNVDTTKGCVYATCRKRGWNMIRMTTIRDRRDKGGQPINTESCEKDPTESRCDTHSQPPLRQGAVRSNGKGTAWAHIKEQTTSQGMLSSLQGRRKSTPTVHRQAEVLLKHTHVSSPHAHKDFPDHKGATVPTQSGMM